MTIRAFSGIGLIAFGLLPALAWAEQPVGTYIPGPVYYGAYPPPPVGPAPPIRPAPAEQAPVRQAAAEPVDPALLPAIEEPPATAPLKPPPKLWEGSFELGINGTRGNSRTLNSRFGCDAKRKTDRDVFSVDLDYRRDTSDSIETAHRLYFDWRYEWLIEDSAWTLFVHGTDDYDEFRPYDVRVTMDAGVGREFIDTDRTSLLGRVGAGCARELGGPDEEYVPEMNFGMDFDHKINDRQKIAANVVYTPEIGEFGDCHVNTKASWEVLLDEEANLSLKVSILDRYDSTPNGARPNDIDYAITLLWSF